MVAGEREEYAAVRAALVGLAGRMEIPRAETETGGHALPVAHTQSQSLECGLVLRVSLHVGKEREIVVCRQAIKVQTKTVGQRTRFRAALPNSGIREHRYAVVNEVRSLT